MNKFKYTLLDELAYNSYLEAVSNNNILSFDVPYICDSLVNKFEEFVKLHQQNEENLRYYYNMNKRKYKKLKLEKLKNIYENLEK
jgi:hypothetical protein